MLEVGPMLGVRVAFALGTGETVGAGVMTRKDELTYWGQHKHDSAPKQTVAAPPLATVAVESLTLHDTYDVNVTSDRSSQLIAK